MKLVLKVDVETLRGTREGVSALLQAFERHHAGATFLFSLGPEPEGILFRADIGRRGGDVMRRVRDTGHEVGIHAWDAIKWRDHAMKADASWTSWQMQLAAQRFREIFGQDAWLHGATGWQMNVHAFRLTQSLGFAYASDTRGNTPFLPVIRAEIVACPQFPTTLPTLDEMIGVNDMTELNVAGRLLEYTATERQDHVFTLSAEREGGRLMPVFEQLLAGWREQGYELVPLRGLVAATTLSALPLHTVLDARVPGRSAPLCLQGPAFLAEESSQ